MLRYLGIVIIRIYQWCISPLIGTACRFTPTCSDYAIGALKKYGLIRGGWRAVKRIVKCGPWNPGGVDDP